MIRTRRDFSFYTQEDKKANLCGKKMSWIEWHLRKLIGNENIMACDYLLCLRKLEYCTNCMNGKIGQLYRLYYEIKLRRLSLKYGIYILPNTVGYGLRLLHFRVGGVILNCKQMGNYCSANSGVIVGNKDSQENRALIGNNVKLTVGSKVIGKVIIGDNVIVAPNSVVIKDVPDNCVVSGIPAIIIKNL